MERQHGEWMRRGRGTDYLDLGIHGGLLAIVFFILVRVHTDVMEGKLLLNTVLEKLPLLQGETISLGNDGHDIDRLAELLENDNVDRFEGVASRGDKVQAAMDARVLDVSLSLSSQLLP